MYNGTKAETVISQLKKTGTLLIGKARRLLIVNLKKGFVHKQLDARKGDCRQCANCCRLVHRCIWLTRDNLCLVYHSRIRPKVCARFPLDARDIGDVMLSSGTKCGYHY
jgi:hypothetical protein